MRVCKQNNQKDLLWLIDMYTVHCPMFNVFAKINNSSLTHIRTCWWESYTFTHDAADRVRCGATNRTSVAAAVNCIHHAITYARCTQACVMSAQSSRNAHSHAARKRTECGGAVPAERPSRRERHAFVSHRNSSQNHGAPRRWKSATHAYNDDVVFGEHPPRMSRATCSWWFE